MAMRLRSALRGARRAAFTSRSRPSSSCPIRRSWCRPGWLFQADCRPDHGGDQSNPVTLQVNRSALGAPLRRDGTWVLVRSAHSASARQGSAATPTGLFEFDAGCEMGCRPSNHPRATSERSGAVAAILGEDHSPGDALSSTTPTRRHPSWPHHPLIFSDLRLRLARRYAVGGRAGRTTPTSAVARPSACGGFTTLEEECWEFRRRA